MSLATTPLRLGSIRIDAVPDGHGRELADVLTRAGHDSPWAGHERLLAADGTFELAVGGHLVRLGDRVVLVDLGVGTIDNGSYRGGAFLDNLAALGITPADVTDVVFTHLHFDHVGWATQKGQVVFPNASYRLHELDWQHFVLADDANPGAQRKLRPLVDQLDMYAEETEIVPGLRAVPVGGHTPGSTVFAIEDGSERALFIGDLAHNEVELLEDGWSFAHDTDPAHAIAARNRLCHEAIDAGTMLIPAHFPHYPAGRLTETDGVRRWDPIEGDL